MRIYMSEVIELIEKSIPALSAIAGGLIVMLSNLVIQRRDKISNKKDFLRQRLEEIYSLSIEAQDWLKSEDIEMRVYVERGERIKLEEKPLRTDRLRMLLNIYFPKLSHHCDELDKFETVFYNGVQLAYSIPAEIKEAKYEETIGKSIKELLHIHFSIRDSIKKEIVQCLN